MDLFKSEDKQNNRELIGNIYCIQNGIQVYIHLDAH